MTQVDFREIEAPTPEIEEIDAACDEIRNVFETATEPGVRLEAFRRWDHLRREIETWSSLVGVRFKQDTRDEDRKAALTARDELMPKLREREVDVMRWLLSGPHRAELESQFGRHLLDLWACEVKTYDPKIEEETVAESKASTAYTELIASARFDFEGERLNLSELGKYAEEKDRDLRHRAAHQRWDWFEANGAALDRIYDELVGLRHAQAAKLGFPSYVELAYRKLGRTDYGPADVARYRRAILEKVVPLCSRIRERQQATLGVDRLMAWDEPVEDPRGNPKPQGDHDWMIDRAREMFDAMGGGLGPFFRLMHEGHLLDLEGRKGKAGGGFCSSFATYGVPFIFANFNGTKGDVEVFTHEMGHAFQGWSSRDKEAIDYLWPTSEACEVHSMSLEFLTWPYMEAFFGNDAERFRRLHLSQSLLFLPYGVAVDHFQHLVFEHPNATPDERHAMWRDLERTYLPWRDWGDLERPKRGAFWQQQLHIYTYPFYYIDYTLAQVCALQFWVRAEEDRENAMAAYVDLCRRGGEAPFQSLVRSAGLRSPFDQGCLDDVVATAARTLGL
ncbi:MAG: M3 family oligoendopeptidase [Planctomycetota bacterium]|jgi:M3 family oligoendopeptidase